MQRCGQAAGTALIGLAAAAGGVSAQVVTGDVVALDTPDRAFGLPEVRSVRFDAPTKDTSTYSNIGASGNTRPFVWMSTFPGEGRQSNLITMFNTASVGIPTGADAGRVVVGSMTFTACTYPSGPQAPYDPTPDPWQNTLWAGGDITVYDFFGGTTPVGTETVGAEPRYVSLGGSEDGNKPVELFAARFNNEWTAASWVESGFGTPAFQNGVYNVEPIDFDENGDERPVLFSMGETGVEFLFGDYVGDDGVTYDTYFPTGNFLPDPLDGFDPNPLAVGVSYTIPNGTPGHSVNGFGQTEIALGDDLPLGHRLRFEVRTDDAAVQDYFRSQFADGWLSFVASQLAIADIGLNGSYSYWMTKEGSATLPPVFDLDPSTLDITYLYLPPGDFNGDGLIAPDDEDAAILAITDPIGFGRAFPLLDAASLTDMDGDGDTDLSDIASIVGVIAELRSEPRRGVIGG